MTSETQNLNRIKINLNLKNTKDMKRRQFKSFRRGLDTRVGYVEPIYEDAFMFGGPEISKKRELDYMKVI